MEHIAHHRTGNLSNAHRDLAPNAHVNPAVHVFGVAQLHATAMTAEARTARRGDCRRRSASTHLQPGSQRKIDVDVTPTYAPPAPGTGAER